MRAQRAGSRFLSAAAEMMPTTTATRMRPGNTQRRALSGLPMRLPNCEVAYTATAPMKTAESAGATAVRHIPPAPVPAVATSAVTASSAAALRRSPR